MKVTYIAHSGFAVDLPSATLLFDYYQGELPAFTTDKPLYIFSSHCHGDHFVPQIFDLAKQYPQVHFILSHDIWLTRKKHVRAGVSENHFAGATYMRAHETRHIPFTTTDPTPSASPVSGESVPHLTVTTLRSTDMGVAFLVECDGLRIYHAGDLHWWLWPGDTKQAANNMTANYQKEIGRLRELLSQLPTPVGSTLVSSTSSDPDFSSPHLDLAFLPLDPRLEENYALGMEYFLRNISVQHVFPMHFWEDYTVVDRFAEISLSEKALSHQGTTLAACSFYKITHPGQQWSLSQISR